MKNIPVKKEYVVSHCIFPLFLPPVEQLFYPVQLFYHILRVILSLKHQRMLTLCAAISFPMSSEQLN